MIVQQTRDKLLDLVLLLLVYLRFAAWTTSARHSASAYKQREHSRRSARSALDSHPLFADPLHIRPTQHPERGTTLSCRTIRRRVPSRFLTCAG